MGSPSSVCGSCSWPSARKTKLMPRSKKTNGIRRNKFFLLGVLPVLAVAVACSVIFKALQNYIASSSYFQVRDIEVAGLSDARYVGLLREEIVGVNTFRLDVRDLADRIRRKYPNFYSVVVTRVLPSRLVITAKERVPVAVLKRDAYYLFDAEGVVLSSFSDGDIFDLPRIDGLENKLPKIRVGAAYSVPGLSPALGLAKILKAERHRIEKSVAGKINVRPIKIDAVQPGNLSFYLGDALEIKVGGGDFESRLRLFPAILDSIAGGLTDVRYIDLRPKEPVVASKDNPSGRAQERRR